MTALICGAIFLAGCSSDDSSPSEPKDNGSGTSLETKSSSIGTDGGTISLSSGASVVFPAGAVESTGNYTVKRIDPYSYGEVDPEVSRVVIECTGDDTTFDVPVEIRVPLPESMTKADSTMVFGGYIDEESGAKEMIACSIEMIEGKPVAVLPLEHFSTGFLEWLFGKTPPATAGPLEIPYYGQGESPYCWAASLQMVSQAAGFETRHEITDIIGKMGVDEGGISSIKFRTSSEISSIIKYRTDVTPDRCTWDGVNYRVMKDYLKRELGVRGYPVAIHSSVWAHAVVVVGYNGDTFYIHDPASTFNSAIGYTAREWKDMVNGMGAGQFMVCLTVPKTLDASRSLITANLMNSAIQFDKLPSDDDPHSRIYKYRWNYTKEDGYTFFDMRDQKAVGALPGEVVDLSQGGDIEIVNASRTSAQEVSIWLDIVCTSTEGVYYSENKRFTVPANSSGRFRFDNILVDKFRYNAEEASEYSLIVRAMAGGTLVDEAAIQFEIESRPVVIKNMTPDRGAPGTKVVLTGSGFGTIPEKTTVEFNGVVAEVDTTVWRDSEIMVIVPEGATTGPITVTNDDVEGSSETFTITKESKVTNTFSHTTDSSFSNNFVMTTNVSYTLSGDILDSGEYSDNYYSYSVATEVPATLTISADAELDTYTHSYVNNNKTYVYTYHKPEMVPLTDNQYEDWPFSVTGNFNYFLSESGVSFTFEHFTNRVWAEIVYRVEYDLDVYNAEGELIEESKDNYFNSRTVGIISISSM